MKQQRGLFVPEDCIDHRANPIAQMWARDLLRRLQASLALSRRMLTLYGPDNRPLPLPGEAKVGSTVTVKLPGRYAKEADV